MSSSIKNKDVKTLGYVLKRTNYGEADRILNLITPQGKIAVIAKGVRKEKSKLAGGIEMFTLTDFNIHFGKSEFGVVTSARMQKHYGEIIKDLNKMELAAMMLKMASRAAEGSDNAEFFKIVDQSLQALDMNEENSLVEAWYLLNLKKAMGEEVNLYRDINGEKLNANDNYFWDTYEMAFAKNEKGEYGADEIKLLRLMVSNDFGVIRRVKVQADMAERVLRLAKMVV